MKADEAQWKRIGDGRGAKQRGRGRADYKVRASLMRHHVWAEVRKQLWCCAKPHQAGIAGRTGRHGGRQQLWVLFCWWGAAAAMLCHALPRPAVPDPQPEVVPLARPARLPLRARINKAPAIPISSRPPQHFRSSPSFPSPSLIHRSL